MNYRFLISLCFGFLFVPAPIAQTLDAPGAVKSAVEAKYHVTQTTADFSDIVTAGDVITLQKSGLVMYHSDTSMARTGNVAYRDGKLAAGGMTKFMSMGNGSANTTRTFVSGEKCWLVGVNVKDDGLFLQFLSDPINDVRYMGSVKFPVDKKGPMPGPDVMLARVAEVIFASPLPSAPPAANTPPAPVEAPPPPIAPPPPPPDQPTTPPPTISLGQTRAQVQADFGQPLRVVKLGTKEIDTYKDMKVTFVNGKVTDVQ